jgi:choline-sulfatase
MPASGTRPNIVYICSDQHSFRYTGYAGHPLVKTPNMDRIAARGTVFANTYCGNPVCTPGRACLMTGMYPSDVGSYCNSTAWDGSHPTWGTRLTESGYTCHATGKFDLNLDFERGFIEKDVRNGHCRNPDITSLFRNPLCYRFNERDNVNGRPRNKRHGDSARTQNCLDFMQNDRTGIDGPWLYYLGLSQPHPKFNALRQYWDMYPLEDIDLPDIREDDLENLHLVFQGIRSFKRIATHIPEDRVRKARAGYYGMITELDEYIGQVWDALEAAGELDNTVFIYTSDHGEALGEHGLWLKNNLYENAAHVPLVMSGPGIPVGKVIETPVAHVDLATTLLDWAGAEGVSDLRGHSMLSLLDDEPGDHPGWTYTESHSEGNCTGSFAIRKGDWKYIHFQWYHGLLYNLKEDPGEFVNRIDDPTCAEVLTDLKAILDSQVDTEQVTRDAFEKQDGVVRGLAEGKTEEEFATLLQGRLGEGQARALASKYVGGIG